MYTWMHGTGIYQRHPTQVSELPDSTILLLGYGQGYQDLKKLDKDGEIVWTKYLVPDTIPPITPTLDINSFQVMSNGNILLAGEKLINGIPALACIYMLNPNGQELFDTVYYSYTYLMKPKCSAKAANGLLIG
jgi:hypothetical protein